MIEVAVYDTKPYDREYFGLKASDKKIRWRFHEFCLGSETDETARGAQVVCVLERPRVQSGAPPVNTMSQDRFTSAGA